MPALESSSSSLIAGAKSRDEEAWIRLTRIYGPAVYGWGTAARMQPADAADVMQNVFQTVAIEIQGFEHDQRRGSFRGWLWKIFRSKLMDLYRERNAAPIDPAELERLCLAAESSANSAAARARERAALLAKALEVIRNDFAESSWEAFWRSAVMNQRTRDVAADLEMTAQAVCAARSRVLKRLRETMDGLDVLPEE